MSKPRLSDFTKMLLQVESTSLDDYSAPDSIQLDGNLPQPKTKPTRIKYDFFDMQTGAIRDDGGPLIEEPSYTNQKSYSVSCAVRRLRNLRKYNQQFDHEIHQLVQFQPKAFEAALLLRTMSYTSLWPPLHTAKEIDYTMRFRVPRSEKYVARLRRLLATDVQ
uniref:Uncharacterized protein n=1 Tax=Glossina austeni TaxID=7395 RepID=A0A1A9VW87_GLOAU